MGPRGLWGDSGGDDKIPEHQKPQKGPASQWAGQTRWRAPEAPRSGRSSPGRAEQRTREWTSAALRARHTAESA